MTKKDCSPNRLNNCPCTLVFLGFFLLMLLSWFGEYLDFPYLFLNAEKTLFNWKEALVESLLIGVIGTFTLIKLNETFNKRREIEKKLIRSQKDLKAEKEKLEEVLNIDCEISSILRLNQLIDFVIEESVKLLKAGRCSLMMLDHLNNELVIKGAKGLKKEIIQNTRLHVGEGIAGKVAQEGKPLFVKDILNTKNFMFQSEYPYRSNSFMVVPIVIRQRVVGVVNVSEKQSLGSGEAIFTEVDFKILCSIVHQAAVSIENAKYYQELEYLTRTDSMTGLNNHRHFVKAMKGEMSRAKRYNRPLSLLMIDVDNFKHFNDTYGHLEGDRLLKKISQVLVSISRDVDICCRYAGDEFIVILPETDIQDAKVFSKKLSLAIKEIKYKEEVSVSIGVIPYNNYEETQLDLIRRVDQKLYEQKSDKKLNSSLL